jgi:RimJ/RimL family protein N-acetyltransferase
VTVGEHRRWYETITTDSQSVIFAVDTIPDRQFVGCVWLHGIDPRHRYGELRVLIGNREYWGSGIGTEAIGMMVRFAFEKINLHKIYAYILAPNTRALRSFQKLGFVREGLLKQERYVDGQFVDVVRLGLVKKE